MKKNIFIKIQYDGSGFKGWQKQPGERTVQGEIEKTLYFLTKEQISINGTSRTDAGVHALEQCATFLWDNPIPVEKLPLILNRRFGAGGMGRSGSPGDIRILSACEMPMDFHARYSSKGKTYKYVIDSKGDIYSRNYVYQFPDELDVDRMKLAAMYIEGTHDFKSFQTSGGTPRESTVRTISRLDVLRDEKGRVIIRVTGDGFLYNMVRIIVGTLVEVGIGKKEPDDLPKIIEAKDRAVSGFKAPPQGLYLEKVYFDENEFCEASRKASGVISCETSL